MPLVVSKINNSMRAHEFVTEGAGGSKGSGVVTDAESRTLPATYAISKLPSQDPYKQYRFGCAIAAARGKEQRQQEGEPEFSPESTWGENEIIVSYEPGIDKVIDDALRMVGLNPSDKKLISTPQSEEPTDTDSTSPVKGFKGYPR